MTMEKVLHLTLKKKWFDMIASGEKTEEYREDKMYWRRRLLIPGAVADGRWYDEIHFKNGYGKNAPFMRVEFKGLTSNGKRKREWGYSGGCFVIRLGKILETRNINKLNP